MTGHANLVLEPGLFILFAPVSSLRERRRIGADDEDFRPGYDARLLHRRVKNGVLLNLVIDLGLSIGSLDSALKRRQYNDI